MKGERRPGIDLEKRFCFSAWHLGRGILTDTDMGTGVSGGRVKCSR